MEREKPLIVITGPTAAGKTDFSIKLAKEINGEIISADSMQVYKGLDIGTDKIFSDRTDGISHYLIDIVSPDICFSVADFVREADEAVKTIRAKRKVPILVGGTGFYIRAFLYGLPKLPSSDKKIREELERLSDQELYSYLRKIDIDYASKISVSDRKRMIRAIEVYRLTGEPLSYFKEPENPKYPFLGYFLYRNRDELYRRIEKRVDSQIDRGLVEEAKKLLTYGKGITAFQALGYKEIVPFLEGEISLDRAILKLKRKTKQFAKRQFTWFKKEKGFKWINMSEVPESVIIRNILGDIKREEIDAIDEDSRSFS